MGLRRTRVRVEGIVQGVGFRPFVWREATSRGLAGWVSNDASGVVLEVEGDPDFFKRIHFTETPADATTADALAEASSRIWFV